MRHSLLWRNGCNWRKRLQFKELVIAIALAGTVEVVVLCLCIMVRMFDEQSPVQPIGQPAAWIWKPDLERRLHVCMNQDVTASTFHIQV